MRKHLLLALAFVPLFSLPVTPAKAANSMAELFEQEVQEAIELTSRNKNFEQFEATMRKFIARGSSKATVTLGRYLCSYASRCVEAVALLQPLANAKNSDAEYELGASLILMGDKKKGYDYVRRAADHGNAQAQAALADEDVVRADEQSANNGQFLDALTGIQLHNLAILPDRVVACFKADRPALIRAMVDSKPACKSDVLAKYGDAKLPGVEDRRKLMGEYAGCLNQSVYTKQGKSPSEIAACAEAR